MVEGSVTLLWPAERGLRWPWTPGASQEESGETSDDAEEQRI